MPVQLTQMCNRCKKTKPLDDFYHNSTKSNFHNGICKVCQLEVNKENVK